MTGNPYGAVVDALKDTRVTLKDIMAAHLQNKVLEGRLNLEAKKSETSLAQVASAIERERMLDARQQEQFTKRMGMEERRVSLAEAAGRRADQEAQRNNEIRTIGEWVQNAGMPAGIIDFLGVDPNRKISRQDAQAVYGNLQNAFKTNPSMGFMVKGYNLRRELTDLQNQLQAAGLEPAAKEKLTKLYDKKLSSFKMLDEFIMAQKAPDSARIAQVARQTWTDNPELQTQYENFDKFLPAFSKSMQQIRSVFQEDIERFSKGKKTLERPAATEKDIQDMQALSARFTASKDPLAAVTLRHASRLIAEGDAMSALELMRKRSALVFKTKKGKDKK